MNDNEVKVTENNQQVEQAPQVEQPVQEENHEVDNAPKESHAEEKVTAGNITLITDSRTGRKRVVTIPDNKKEESPKEEPKEEPTDNKDDGLNLNQPEANPNPINQAIEEMNKNIQNTQQPVQQNIQQNAQQYYKPEEMVLAMQLGNVDESKIPPHLKQQYEALKHKNDPPQPTQEEAEKEVRKKISEMAKEEAMKKTGATEDDIQLGEFSDDAEVQQRVRDYKVAYDLAVQRIIRDSFDKYAKMQEESRKQQEVRNNVRNFIQEQRAKEPHFDEIGQMMNTAYLNMPYKQASIIAPVVDAARKGIMSQEQANILGQYYEICRKALYARINKTSVTPKPVVPKVEKRGTGASAPKNVDYAKMLREASVRDKSKVLAAWLNSRKK